MSTAHDVYAARFATATGTRAENFLRYGTYHEPDGELVCHFYFWPVIGPSGVTLLDAGFDDQTARKRGQTVDVEMRAALGAIDLQPGDVSRIVLSHLHFDHTGNLDLFPQAEIYVQAAEWAFWNDPIASRRLYREMVESGDLEQLRQADADGRLHQLSGDTDLAPGISVLSLPGHTPGQQGLLVQTAERPVILASDAVHYYDELRRDRPFVIVEHLAAMYGSFDRLRQMETAGAVVVPGHDAEVLEQFDTRHFVDGLSMVTLA